MLIVTRRIGQAVRIGDDIFVTVLGVQGNQIRLGLGAPRDVKILREELVANSDEDDDVTELRQPEGDSGFGAQDG